ncbi:hypothetical protein Pth03_48710 [Planotetraspora thailandica]|uniref:DUF320 domain-containing protein n=1 Tax=Planotetraspora thailandica TaxID=487172 RepID=A0A8J3XVF2_9ACTN|nr:hypothetical protein [Planotetraspora thailandica]GII56482.1 hypothetical protein Pth03_48710 [Planotetraspora thailandica]
MFTKVITGLALGTALAGGALALCATTAGAESNPGHGVTIGNIGSNNTSSVRVDQSNNNSPADAGSGYVKQSNDSAVQIDNGAFVAGKEIKNKASVDVDNEPTSDVQ